MNPMSLLSPIQTASVLLVRSILRAGLVLLVFLSSFISARAVIFDFNSGVIGFDYNLADYGFPGYGPGPGAIGSAGDVWNTASTVDTSPLSLNKTDGTPTSAVWNLSGGGGVGSNIGGTYARLMDINTYFSSASITGLTPNRQYNLYLYNAYWDETIQVNGVDFFETGIRFGSVDTLTEGSEYAVHTVTSDSSGTLSFTPISWNATYGNPYITSWQLTPVPEPRVMAFAGLLFLASWMRRRIFQRML